MSRKAKLIPPATGPGGISPRRVLKVEVAPIDYIAIEGGLQKQMRDYHLVALCDDGSVWRFGVGGAAEWQRMSDVPFFDYPDTGLGKSNGTVAIKVPAGPIHLT